MANMQQAMKDPWVAEWVKMVQDPEAQRKIKAGMADPTTHAVANDLQQALMQDPETQRKLEEMMADPTCRAQLQQVMVAIHQSGGLEGMGDFSKILQDPEQCKTVAKTFQMAQSLAKARHMAQRRAALAQQQAEFAQRQPALAQQKAVMAQRIAAHELVKAALSDEEKEAAVAALKAALRRAAQPEGALLALMLAPREASAAPSEAAAPSEGPGGAAWNWEQRRATLWLQEAALEQQFAVLMQREAAILLIEIEMGLSGLGNTKYGIIK